MVTTPSVVRQVFAQRTAVSSIDMTYYVMEKFFGDKGGLRELGAEVVFGPIHKALNLLLREPFLSQATDVTVKNIEERTPNLISFSSSIVDQTIWERSANLSVLPGP